MNKIINKYFTYVNAPTLQNFTWGGGVCNTYLKSLFHKSFVNNLIYIIDT